jgi:hypothetical protein
MINPAFSATSAMISSGGRVSATRWTAFGPTVSAQRFFITEPPPIRAVFSAIIFAASVR